MGVLRFTAPVPGTDKAGVQPSIDGAVNPPALLVAKTAFADVGVAGATITVKSSSTDPPETTA